MKASLFRSLHRNSICLLLRFNLSTPGVPDLILIVFSLCMRLPVSYFSPPPRLILKLQSINVLVPNKSYPMHFFLKKKLFQQNKRILLFTVPAVFFGFIQYALMQSMIPFFFPLSTCRSMVEGSLDFLGIFSVDIINK